MKHNSNRIATVRFECIKVCVGDYYKVGHYNGTGFFVKAHFEAEKAGRTVLWFSDDHWWITTITPTPAAEEAISWLAKGSRISPDQCTDPCNMSDVHWFFPVKNISHSNKWCRMEPSQTQLFKWVQTQDEKLKKLEADLAAATADLQTKDARIAALELAASEALSSPGASSSTWQRSDPAMKTGWKNKMAAILAAIHNQDSPRINHLAEV